MIRSNNAWFCYLPQSTHAQEWGIFVLDAGYTIIPPNTPYPPGKHPDDHMFSWETGRTLDSYQLVYITRGGGLFESSSGKKHTIREGDLFVLHPGEWHRYRPDPATGWDEYWVEFDGEQARRIMQYKEFPLKQPVFPIGADAEILKLYVEIAEAMQTQSPGFENIIATQTLLIVARILADMRYKRPQEREAEKIIRRARLQILKHAEEPIDFELLASDLGVSYSFFRQRFKEITGLPPGQYQIQIRLKKAGHLLRNSNLPVAAIAAQVGFESIYYFSRLFKKKSGLSPLAFRKQRGSSSISTE